MKRSILLFLILIGGVNLLLSWKEEDLSYIKEQDRFVWHTKISNIRNGSVKDVEYLFLGDSQVMSGVLPDRLDGNYFSGRNIYNLGLPAMQPEGLLVLTDTILANMPRLKVIFMNVGPYSLFTNDNLRAFDKYYLSELYYRALTSAFRSWIQPKPGSAGMIVHGLLKNLPLYRFNDDFSTQISYGSDLSGTPLSILIGHPELADRVIVGNYLNETYKPARRIRKEVERNRIIGGILQRNRGYWSWGEVEPVLHDCKSESVDQIRRLPVKPEFRLRKEAVISYEKIIKKYDEVGVDVVLLRIPLSPQWYRLAGNDGLRASMQDAVTKLAESYPRLRIIPAPPGDFFARMKNFADFTHLSYCGAIRYSRYLSDTMVDDGQYGSTKNFFMFE